MAVGVAPLAGDQAGLRQERCPGHVVIVGGEPHAGRTCEAGKVTQHRVGYNQGTQGDRGLCGTLHGKPSPGWNGPWGRGEGGQKTKFETQNSLASYPPQIQKILKRKEKAPEPENSLGSAQAG